MTKANQHADTEAKTIDLLDLPFRYERHCTRLLEWTTPDVADGTRHLFADLLNQLATLRTQLEAANAELAKYKTCGKCGHPEYDHDEGCSFADPVRTCECARFVPYAEQLENQRDRLKQLVDAAKEIDVAGTRLMKNYQGKWRKWNSAAYYDSAVDAYDSILSAAGEGE